MNEFPHDEQLPPGFLESLESQTAPSAEWVEQRFARQKQEFHSIMAELRTQSTPRALLGRVVARFREVTEQLSISHQLFLAGLSGELLPEGARASDEILTKPLEGQELSLPFESGVFHLGVVQKEQQLLLVARLAATGDPDEVAAISVRDQATGDLIDGPRPLAANQASVSYPDPSPGIYEFTVEWKGNHHRLVVEVED